MVVSSASVSVILLLSIGFPLLQVPLASGFAATPKKPQILSFGNACVDLLAICDHFPVPDEKMHSSELRYEGGGNAANSACAMGRLSDYCSVSVATAIGTDDYGERIIKGLIENNVDTEHMERIDGNSPFSYILVTPEPDNARTIIHQPASRDMSVEFADTIDISRFTTVHFDGRHSQAAVRLSEKLVKEGIPYSVDVERPRGSHHAKLLEDASVIICSSDYCNKVLGPCEEPISDQERVDRLKQIIKLQAPNAVLALQTIGSKGSYLIRLNDDDGDDLHYQDSARVIVGDKEGEDSKNAPTVSLHHGALWCPTWGGIDIVDSTGAGDAFQGGFLTGLWSFMEHQQDSQTKCLHQVPVEALARAMRIGTRVAAKKLESLGARTGLPYASQDIALQSEFERLLAVKEEQQAGATA